MRSWLIACCDLYNGALQERRDAWRVQRRGISLYDQGKSLTEIRASVPGWADVPRRVAFSALIRLDRAFKSFFRRCKSGGAPGFPRFRSRARYDSFSLLMAARVDGNRVRLPKIGLVKFNQYRPIRGKILDIVVCRDGDRWFICFQCDLGDAPPKVDPARHVGLDVGLSSLATLSTGEAVENPRHYRKSQATLRRRQQALARKRKGSLSRRRAASLVRKAHDHVKNQRLDYARKVAGDLVSRFDLIAFEDLNIRGLAQTPLAKSINDAGWRILLQAIVCKAESAGRHAVAVDARGTSQECSACGARCQKTLSDRIHRCACGCAIGRDHNAALNILARGRRAVSEAFTRQRPEVLANATAPSPGP